MVSKAGVAREIVVRVLNHTDRDVTAIYVHASYGEPNPGGAGFPEQSQYWCLSNDRLKEMFVGKKGGSNNSSAYSGAIKGLISRNLLQMNAGLVWMPTDDGKCTSAERRGAAASV